ncbi:YaiI/YqxD family protein [Algibacillus agarilyticus]|uniref:YaiI/YqxD family protein n=1 Tax=Algibacillus agarilyticus TaxID=2234133 RepID=UPI000DCFE72F|nr:YaiI/YqxD family protein [Algibacillus agarilyticus]
MKIWVDADACPVAIKEILFRLAQRTKIHLTLVANHSMRVPNSPYISFVHVQQGFDVADNEIVKRINPNDLVITGDIPLADEIITAGGQALNPRGELFTKENIKQRLNIRDFMDNMRASGVETQGPPPLNQTDRQNFANNLDRIVSQYLRSQK